MLTSDCYLDTGGMACPNCGAGVPQAAYEALRDGLKAFKRVEASGGFSFSLVNEPIPF